MDDWEESFYMGIERKLDVSDTRPEAKLYFRCEICKQPIAMGEICQDEGCLTIISMMSEENGRIKMTPGFPSMSEL